MAMPRLAGGVVFTVSPAILISPALASSSPAMMRNSVDFPQPEGPTKITNSPSSTDRSMPCSTSVEPKVFLIFESSRAVIGRILSYALSPLAPPSSVPSGHLLPPGEKGVRGCDHKGYPSPLVGEGKG